MTHLPIIIQKLKRTLSSYSSLLLLFQRSPLVQMLCPQANFLASSAALNSTGFAIATVVGLGAYDSVAGATTVIQVLPETGTIVHGKVGESLTSIFQIQGTIESPPQSWSISSGTLPAGVSLTYTAGVNGASLTGTPTVAGDKTVTIRAWEFAGFNGNSAAGTFTISIAPGNAAAISVQPASTTINRGQTATLTVTGTGSGTLAYQWYQGASGDTANLISGATSATYVTPVLTSTTSYWVKVSNGFNPTGVNSNTAVVTVRQPATITTQPVPVTISKGQTANLTVTATGDAPLHYQWYRGVSGDTANPVGTDSNSYTTTALNITTNYWVKVTNVANSSGDFSNTTAITVLQPPVITTAPASTNISSGQSVVLSVNATGSGTLTYKWYEGSTGVTTKPVGTNSSTFNTGPLFATTRFWVNVSNTVDPTGADSAAALITVSVTTPPWVYAMSQIAGLVTPTTRSNLATTYFGWDTFNEPGARSEPINDSTPDIGAAIGANFQTTVAEDHVVDVDGNFFFSSGTLSEQITIPTDGTVGAGGKTTIVLQISAPSGSGPFPAAMTLSSINGVAPTVVQAVNSAGDGQLWAIWKVPGNEASYIVTLTGAPGQANFAFDKVVVDTLFSDTVYMPDSVAATPPSITTSSALPFTVVGAAYSQQLAGTGGTEPYQYTVTSGSLPDGLTLSLGGLLSGNATAASNSHFTVVIHDANLLIGSKSFDLSATTTPAITTSTLLPAGFANTAYSKSLAVTGGTAPYTWTIFPGDTLPDGLTLSTAGVISGTPTTVGLTAFVVKVQDANGLSDLENFSLRISDLAITSTGLPTAVKNVAFSFNLSGTGGEPAYTWDVGGGELPPGITLSPTGVLSGSTTATGAFNFSARLQDSVNVLVTKSLNLTVSANYVPPVLDPLNFPVAVVGTQFDYILTAQNYPKTFTVTGLPPGLKYVAASHSISGRSDLAGVFNIQVRATNTGGSSVLATAPLTIKGLEQGLVGTFGGTIQRDDNVNGKLGGWLTVTITPTGSYSIKLTGALAGSGAKGGSATYSATGRLSATAFQIADVPLGGRTLNLAFNAATGAMTGSLGAANVVGWRAAWDAVAKPASSLQGYYSFGLTLFNAPDLANGDIPKGTGFATANVGLSGSIATVGKTADGESITGSSFLGANGEFWLYTPLYKNLGSIQGNLMLAQDPAGLFAANAISGIADWFKPATTGRSYLTAFGPAQLDAKGRYLALNSKGNAIQGLPAPGNVNLAFSDGGLTTFDTNPNLTFTFSADNKVGLPDSGSNPGAVAITINPATGAVAGTFTVTKNSPPALTRPKVPFQGQIVRTDDGNLKAVGYFLLPQVPIGSQTAATAPSLSGAITLTTGAPIVTGSGSGSEPGRSVSSIAALAINTSSLPTAVKNVPFNFTFSGSGGTPPYTWAITTGGLPTGISFDVAGVSGTPTTPGDSTFTLKLTDSTNAFVTKDLTLTVSANYLPPVVDPISFPAITVGAQFDYLLTAQNYPKTFTVTGLPPGLKYVAATKTITGIPEVSGIFNIQVRATNTGGSSPLVTAPLTIKGLKDGLVGTFGGTFTRESTVNGDLGGQLTVTITTNGAYSLKLTGSLAGSGAKGGSATYMATGRVAATAPQITVPSIGGQALTITLDANSGAMTGNLGIASLSGWRSAWNALINPAQSRQGYYSFGLSLTNLIDRNSTVVPHGTGFATLTSDLAGAVVVVGKTADGEAITGSSFLSATGQFWIYTPLYKNKGSIQGALTITQDVGGQFSGNLVTGNPDWYKPATTSLSYPDAFGPVGLTAEGGYLASTSKTIAILGLPAPTIVQVNLSDGGLTNYTTHPSTTFTWSTDYKISISSALDLNPGKVAITLNPATGAVAGNFTLVQANPLHNRSKVPFQGQVVRQSDGSVKAVGYFMLPQIPDVGQTPATAPSLSGLFSLTQPGH